MATNDKRTGKNGTTTWRAGIRVKGQARVATFDFRIASNTAHSLFELMWSRVDHSGEIEVSYDRICAAGVSAVVRAKKACDEIETIALELKAARS